MLASYRSHLNERAAMGTPPLPLGSEQTTTLVELLKTPAAEVEIS
jgi:aconitate hydratase 2/2-methylisocitrate dehydratase